MISCYLNDSVPGQRFSGGTRIRIDEHQIKTFAAEFDPQPIHVEEGIASTSVFRGLAASGWRVPLLAPAHGRKSHLLSLSDASHRRPGTVLILRVPRS